MTGLDALDRVPASRRRGPAGSPGARRSYVALEAAKDPFFAGLKETTVLGYCTSEIGATQALAYAHVPGDYRGCLRSARPEGMGHVVALAGRGREERTYDAIVVGSGISGGWAAKELTRPACARWCSSAGGTSST